MKVKIYYHDTDCGGVVYYANYLKYLEEARSEYFETRSLIIKDLLAKGIGFVVARQEVDAEFVQLAGALFNRDWFKILDRPPQGVQWVRSWDLAFTEKTSSDFLPAPGKPVNDQTRMLQNSGKEKVVPDSFGMESARKRQPNTKAEGV